MAEDDHQQDPMLPNQQDPKLSLLSVDRIMRKILPPSARISQEAKKIMEECAREFISFVANEASQKAREQKRKMINGDDICDALSSLGLDDYVPPMRRYLEKYREFKSRQENRDGPSIDYDLIDFANELENVLEEEPEEIPQTDHNIPPTDTQGEQDSNVEENKDHSNDVSIDSHDLKDFSNELEKVLEEESEEIPQTDHNTDTQREQDSNEEENKDHSDDVSNDSDLNDFCNELEKTLEEEPEQIPQTDHKLLPPT